MCARLVASQSISYGSGNISLLNGSPKGGKCRISYKSFGPNKLKQIAKTLIKINISICVSKRQMSTLFGAVLVVVVVQLHGSLIVAEDWPSKHRILPTHLVNARLLQALVYSLIAVQVYQYNDIQGKERASRLISSNCLVQGTVSTHRECHYSV